jgi:hypothetical protein
VDDQTAGATPPRPTSKLVADVVRALRGWVLAAAGGVLILGCYLGVSAETEVGRQIPYLVSGGFFGLALVIVGAALLVADRIDAGRSQTRTAAQIEDLHNLIVAGSTPDPSSYYNYAQPAGTGTGGAPGPAGYSGYDPAASGGYSASPAPAGADDGSTAASAAVYDDGALYAVPTGRTFHRAYCELLAGKPAQQVDMETVAARTLSPCSVCTPSFTNA